MAEERVQRRLAAILAADVVGYSRLMGEDETGTLTALKQHRATLIDPTIAEHRGRIVKLMGDGVLVEFASVVDAVECAVSIQSGMVERNANTADTRRITFRIGVNLGDIIIDDDDIYGDGVNVAARLEGLAQPGGICVSEKVFAEVRTKLETDFEDLGPQQVKNIAEPVRAYRVTLDRGPVAPKAAPPPLPDKPSIAVLPFDNMSGDPEQEFFADGLAEDIIAILSKTSKLMVIARNSSFAYRLLAGRALDMLGDLEQALTEFEYTARGIDFTSQLHIASVLVRLGRLPEAKGALSEALRFNSQFNLAAVDRYLMSRDGDYVKAITESLREAGLPE